MAVLEGRPALLALTAVLLLACPAAWAQVGQEIPMQQKGGEEIPSGLGEEVPSQASEVVPAVLLPPGVEAGGLLGPLGDLKSGGGAGFESGYGGYDTTLTPPATGGDQWDLGSALFYGNAEAFTQAVLAAGGLAGSAAASTMPVPFSGSNVPCPALLQAPNLPPSPSRAACSSPPPRSPPCSRAWLGPNLGPAQWPGLPLLGGR